MKNVRVKCLSCHESIEVKPIPYGYGYIATCPKCGKLALNTKDLKDLATETK
jgi:Zn finger protein HypA/HybF involved in hydrogenase expression